MSFLQQPSASFGLAANDLDCLVKELSDKNSLWYDLRVTEMSGYDYVFAPDAVCRQLNCTGSWQIFIGSIQTILASARGRVVLVSYWHDRYRQLHFEEHVLSWTKEKVTGWNKKLLDQTPQQDFIRTLFEHSEHLVR